MSRKSGFSIETAAESPRIEGELPHDSETLRRGYVAEFIVVVALANAADSRCFEWVGHAEI